jgi:hypothetical protein
VASITSPFPRWTGSWPGCRSTSPPGARPRWLVVHRARRLPAGQPDVPPHRAARAGRAGLGALHPGPPAGRLQLPLHVLAHPPGHLSRHWRPGHAALGIPTEAEYIAQYCERTGFATPPSRPTGTFTWPTTCSAWPPSCKALPSGSKPARHRATRPKPRARVRARWPRWPGNSRTAPSLIFAPTPIQKDTMDFDYTPKVKACSARLLAFMDEHIYPNEARYHAEIAANRAKGNAWVPLQLIEELKPKARAAGLWNLFLPRSPRAPEGLSNLEYAPCAKSWAACHLAAEVFNCSAPDTGNMETWSATPAKPSKTSGSNRCSRRDPLGLSHDRARAVASSDATNIQCRIERDGDDYVINGRKWWSSGAGDPRCAIFIVMGKTDPEAPRHSQQSMIMVPANTPGITICATCRVRLRRRAPRPHGGAARERARAGQQHAAGRRPWLRNRPGPPGPRPHPPLHALHRRGRARAGTDVQALNSAWPSANRLGPNGVARAHCRVALHDRPWPACSRSRPPT